MITRTAHRTFAGQRGGGGGGGGSSGPPALADVGLWFKGDVGLNSTAGHVSDVNGWENQGSLGAAYNVGKIGLINPTPFTGRDSIDGIPCIDYDLGAADGAELGFGVGPIMAHTAPRTLMAIFRPRYSAAAFGITGGAIFSSIDTGPQFVWTPRFELDDNAAANGYYVLGPPGSFGTGNKGPNTVGGAGGAYNGIPAMGMWTVADSAVDLAVLRNGVNMPVTPAGPVSEGGTTNLGFRIGNGRDGGRNFYGSIAEIILWFKVLSAVEQAQAIIYAANRYPSIPMGVP